MAGILCSAHMRANSSGEEAPSRKLNADRACSSTYINRRFPARTSLRAASHSKNGRGRNRDAMQALHHGSPRKNENESPDPIRPAARDLPATSRRMCAMDRRRPALVRGAPEKKRAWDALHATRASRERAGEKFEKPWTL